MGFRLALNSCLRLASWLASGDPHPTLNGLFVSSLQTKPWLVMQSAPPQQATPSPQDMVLTAHPEMRVPSHAVCRGIGDPVLLSLCSTVGRKLVPMRLIPAVMATILVGFLFLFLFWLFFCLRLFSVDRSKPFSLLCEPCPRPRSVPLFSWNCPLRQVSLFPLPREGNCILRGGPQPAGLGLSRYSCTFS